MCCVARGSMRGLQAAEPGDVLAEGGDLALGERGRRQSFVGGAPDDLVVDVGEVADEGHALAAGAEVADEDVGGDEGAGVADVRARVDRDAAPVDADVPRLARRERLLAARERVGEDQLHAATYSSSSRSLASTE